MKKVLSLILIFSFAISCGGVSMVGGPLIPKPKPITPDKIGLVFEVIGGNDADYTSQATFKIIYKENDFDTDTKEEMHERIAKYSDCMVYTAPYLFGEFQAKVYPESKIIVEVFPSEVHNIKAVLYDGVELVVKNNKVEIVLEKKPANNDNFFYYRSISVVFEIKDSYLESPVIVGDEYQVSSAKQLRWIASRAQRGENFEGKTVKLTTDIDMENKNFSGISSGFLHDKDNIFFAGTFDGNNKKIKNLKIEFPYRDSGYSYKRGIGFIGVLSSKGVVKNLIVQSGNIEGFSNVGIVGRNFGLIEKVENYATIRGFMLVGGLVGYNYQGKLDNNTNNASITAYGEVGGIVGLIDNGSIKNSVNNGSITSENKSVGQIVGYNNKNLGALENNTENGTATDGVDFD